MIQEKKKVEINFEVLVIFWIFERILEKEHIKLVEIKSKGNFGGIISENREKLFCSIWKPNEEVDEFTFPRNMVKKIEF
jgi:hypothetical protein